LKQYASEIVGTAGLGLVTIGIAHLSHAAALIFLGAFLIVAGVGMAIQQNRVRK
jgi:uncharacterized membrane protein HdeD (DUF308 family)